MPFSRCCTHRFKLFPDPFAVVKEIKCIDKCSVRYEKEKGKSKGNEYFYGENTWQEADMAGYFFKRHAGNDGRILLHAYERAECGQKKFICSIMHADLNTRLLYWPGYILELFRADIDVGSAKQQCCCPKF